MSEIDLVQFKWAVNDFLKVVLVNVGYRGLQLFHIGDEMLIEIYVENKPTVVGPNGLHMPMLRNEIQRMFRIDRLSIVVEQYPPQGLCLAALAGYSFFQRLGIPGFQPTLPVKWLINDYLNQAMLHAGYRGMKMFQSGEESVIEVYVENKRSIVGQSGSNVPMWKGEIQRRFQIDRLSLRVENFPPTGLCAPSQANFLQRTFLEENTTINDVQDLGRICFRSLHFIMDSGALGCAIYVRIDNRLYAYTAGTPIAVDTEDHPDVDWATSAVGLRAFWCLMAVRILRPKISAVTTDWDRLGSDWDRTTPMLTIYDIVRN